MALLTLPGLIDPHVHLRDPGQTHKEDFYTGTCAALAGGYTTVLDMPNNVLPIITEKRLDEKIKEAKRKIVCDVGFYFGSLGENLEELKKIQNRVYGIKLYLNLTTGKFILDKKGVESIYNTWIIDKPILVHAEDDVINFVIEVIKKTGKRTHVCHISSEAELKPVIKAKKDGLPVTCGVTAHHLFLTKFDQKSLKSFGKMKPSLKSKKDQNFLWKNLKYIDVIESDHAPHTIEEKRTEEPFGVPGLETTLPLLMTAMQEKRLSMSQIKKLCFDNPKKIFRVTTHAHTKIEVDLNEKYIISNKELNTKSGWTPFDGMKVRGRVKSVFIRGKKVFDSGRILVKPGFGQVI